MGDGETKQRLQGTWQGRQNSLCSLDRCLAYHKKGAVSKLAPQAMVLICIRNPGSVEYVSQVEATARLGPTATNTVDRCTHKLSANT